MMRFNPPPGWPAPPSGWQPSADWRPDPSWPPAPPGWAFWVDDVALPEPRVVLRKVANLLVEDARLDLDPSLAAAQAPVSRVEPVIEAFRGYYGGLWVGGTLTLTDRSVDFRANALNRAVQSGTLDLSVPLGAIAAVEVQPGVLTRIVAMTVGERVVKARMYGADRVAETIQEAAAQAR
ncbi:MAG: hypothetical protein QM582_08030 [Micropruina sp.]|uniref:hypothetical protein n=1 Tax=Micropruina sp. TaxID=2737536 RepID=UPI0039E33330